MKLIFDSKFRFYTSRMNESCLHCHWLYFFHSYWVSDIVGADWLPGKLPVKFRKIIDKKCISIFSASLILNWEDDSEIYHDRKTKSEHNGDEEVGLNENNETRGQKVFIPTHLSPVVRTKRFIFVFLFMFVDASLTIRNVSLGGYFLVIH